MKTKILVIFISFIFLFTYTIQCFAVTDALEIKSVNNEIENETKNEETNDSGKEIIEAKEEKYEIVNDKETENKMIDEEKEIEVKIIDDIDKNKKSETKKIENDDKNLIRDEVVVESDVKEDNGIIDYEELDYDKGEDNLEVAKYSGMICIDSPKINQKFNVRNSGNIINISGWAVSDDFEAKLQCIVDNHITNASFTRVKREDVDRLISPSYGGVDLNKNAGFKCTTDIGLLNTGIHSIKIQELSKYNDLIYEKEITINIENPPYLRRYMY